MKGYNFHFKALINTVSHRNINWVIEQNYHNVVGHKKYCVGQKNLFIQLRKILNLNGALELGIIQHIALSC